MRIKNLAAVISLITSVTATYAVGRTVPYPFDISDTTVVYAGKIRKTVAINGSLPAPVMKFNSGDTAVVKIHNMLDAEVSVRWHGMHLPDSINGSLYLSSDPVKPGELREIRFVVGGSGTCWYDTFSSDPDAGRAYGAVVVYGEGDPQQNEHTILLNDFTGERTKEVLRSVRNNTPWYAVKNRASLSWGEAVTSGNIKAKAKQEWGLDQPITISETYYPAFLMNGLEKIEERGYSAGKKVRLRIVNASASTSFRVDFSGGKITVIAADGSDVEPVEIDRLTFAVGESYDIMVTLPENKRYELRAISGEQTGSASLWLGDGEDVPCPDIEKLHYFEGVKAITAARRAKRGVGKPQFVNIENLVYPADSLTDLNYEMLHKSATYNSDTTVHTKDVRLEIKGNLIRYLWTINGKPLASAEDIKFREGEKIRFIVKNSSSISQPLYIHGHRFVIQNGEGDSPAKNTVDIMADATDTLTVLADNPGNWYLVSAVSFRMLSGLGVPISYEGFDGRYPERLEKSFRRQNKPIRLYNEAMMHSQTSWLTFIVWDNLNDLKLKSHWNYNDDFEIEAKYGRIIDRAQRMKIVLGADYNSITTRRVPHGSIFSLAANYLLPMYINAELRLEHSSRVRLEISRSNLAITSRLRFDGSVNTYGEYSLTLKYLTLKHLAFSVNHDNTLGWGAGVTLTY